MTGNTPYLGIPYPLGTDYVTDGDNAIRLVAEAMDGTAWVYPALGAGWSTTADRIAYRKDGVGNVHIQGYLQAPAGAGLPPAFVLPEGFRPSFTLSVWAANLTDAAKPGIAVYPTGNVGTTYAAATAFLVNGLFSTLPRT